MNMRAFMVPIALPLGSSRSSGLAGMRVRSRLQNAKVTIRCAAAERLNSEVASPEATEPPQATQRSSVAAAEHMWRERNVHWVASELQRLLSMQVISFLKIGVSKRQWNIPFPKTRNQTLEKSEHLQNLRSISREYWMPSADLHWRNGEWFRISGRFPVGADLLHGISSQSRIGVLKHTVAMAIIPESPSRRKCPCNKLLDHGRAYSCAKHGGKTVPALATTISETHGDLATWRNVCNSEEGDQAGISGCFHLTTAAVLVEKLTLGAEVRWASLFDCFECPLQMIGRGKRS